MENINYEKQQANKNEVLYTARRSVWAYPDRVWVCSILIFVGLAAAVFLFINGSVFGIVGIIVALVAALILVLTFIEASKYAIIFYSGKIVVKSGLLNTRESQSVMTPIIGVEVQQSLGGKIFNYGDVIIDKTGRGWDINTRYIKDPDKLKQFLQSLIDSTDYSKMGMYISN